MIPGSISIDSRHMKTFSVDATGLSRDGHHGQQAPRSHRAHPSYIHIKAPFSTSFRNVLWVISAPGPHTLTFPLTLAILVVSYHTEKTISSRGIP